ncbi:hypothetical protein ACS0TY_026254 [Phlomoides rotata]
MPGFCMSRVIARVRSPLQQYKKGSSFIRGEEQCELSYEIDDLSFNRYLECSNRVMIVVDSSYEAKGALEWALSHTVQIHDTVILFHVHRKDGKTNEKIYQSAYDLLQATKNVCQLRRPKVHVEISIQQGKEKGATIVEAAKQLRASHLVLGQRTQSFIRYLQIWRRIKTWSMVVDYCIQNADCMTIAVRRKSRRHEGYLITTKHHKNFWLLA